MKYLKFSILFIVLTLSWNLTAQSAKIDSVSYAIGVELSNETQRFKNRSKWSETKFNSEVYLSGFNNAIDSTAYVFPIRQQEALLHFLKLESDLVNEMKKSTKLNISKGASIKTLMDSLSYCLGVEFGGKSKSKIKIFEKKFKVNKKSLKLGFNTGFKTTIYSAIHKSRKTIIEFKNSRIAKIYKQYRLDNENFIENNKKKKGVKTTETGLQYLVLKEGNGIKPFKYSHVKVNFHGTLLDGTLLISSIGKKPKILPLSAIAGWSSEAIGLMTLGSKYKFFIPFKLTSEGKNHSTKIKPFSAKVYEIELLEILTFQEAIDQTIQKTKNKKDGTRK